MKGKAKLLLFIWDMRVSMLFWVRIMVAMLFSSITIRSQPSVRREPREPPKLFMLLRLLMSCGLNCRKIPIGATRFSKSYPGTTFRARIKIVIVRTTRNVARCETLGIRQVVVVVSMPFTCVHCSLEVQTRRILDQHYDRVHQLVHCGVCDKFFVTDAPGGYLEHFQEREHALNVLKRRKDGTNGLDRVCCLHWMRLALFLI